MYARTYSISRVGGDVHPDVTAGVGQHTIQLQTDLYDTLFLSHRVRRLAEVHQNNWHGKKDQITFNSGANISFTMYILVSNAPTTTYLDMSYVRMYTDSSKLEMSSMVGPGKSKFASYCQDILHLG